MSLGLTLKRTAYVIVSLINPWGVNASHDIDAIPVWAALLICLAGLLFLALAILAGIIYVHHLDN